MEVIVTLLFVIALALACSRLEKRIEKLEKNRIGKDDD